MSRADLRGSLAATAAFAAVGSLVAAADVIEDYPLAPGQTVRYAVAALALFALARFRAPRPGPLELARLAALALTGLVLFNVCIVGGVRELDASTVGVIVGCVPVVLAILGPLQGDRAIRPRVVLAALVVTAGAAIVQDAGASLTTAGLLFALGALACEAAFSLVAVPLLARLGALGVSAWACLLAVPMFALWTAVIDGGSVQAPSQAEIAALGYQAIAVTAGGFLCWYTAIGLLGVERAGLFSGVLPIAALLCAVAIGAESLAAGKLVGAAVVALGVTIGMTARQPPPLPVG